MNRKLQLLAMTMALLLTATACGAPAAASGTSSESSSQATSSSSSEATTPSADTTAPTDKPATGFTLSIPMEYDSAGPFSDGLAMVGTGSKENRQYSYIDTTGNKVFDLESGVSGSDFANGVAQVYNSATYSTNFVDKTGKLLLEQWISDERGMGGGGGELSRAIGFGISESQGLPKYWSGSQLYVEGIEGTSALFDSSIKTVIPFGTYSYLQWVPDTDYVIATQGVGGTSLTGVIKVDGSAVIEAKYSNMSAVGTIGFAVKETSDASTKLMLHDGTMVEPQGYKANHIWYNRDTNKIYFNVVEADGSAKNGIMDNTGKVEGELSVDNLDPAMSWGMQQATDAVAPDGLQTIHTNSTHQVVATGEQLDADYNLTPDIKVGIADLAGNIIVKPTYEGISLPYGGIFVTSNGYEFSAETGWTTSTGYVLVSMDEKVKSDTYKDFGYMGEGLVAVSDGTKWGYVKVAY